MPNRFANPRGVLAEILDMSAEEIPDIWLKDKEIFSLITEYYGPSLKVLEDPDRAIFPRLNAIGTTLDKKTYALKIQSRIIRLKEVSQGKRNKRFLFWKRR